MADFLLSVGVDVGLSYEQMKKDISNLVSDLNKTPPKIKVAFDIDQKAVESLRNQITAINKQLGSASTNTSSGSTRRKATAEIADIANEARRAANTQAAASKKAANAEKEHETSLRQVLNTYRELLAAMRTNQNAQVASTYSELVKQADLFGSALEIAEDKAISIDAALKQVGLDGSTAIENAKTALAAFRAEMEQTGSSGTINMSQMYSVIAQMQNLLNSNANAAALSSYTVLQEQVRLFTNALQLASSGSLSLSEALKQVGLDGSTAIEGAKTAMSAFRAEVAGATFEEVKLSKGTEQYNAALNKVNTLLAAVRSNTEKWTAAKNGNSSKDYQIYSQQADALERLSRELQTGTMSAREFNNQFSEIKTTTVQSSVAIRAAGENTQTFSERIGSLSSKFGTWFSITRVIMAAFRSVKQMVSAVIELDTAMTELKKVTDETDATYEKFLVNAASRAKQLGAALSDTVTATADFARLGFSIEEAEKLADTAIVYKNVGDGIKDISEASESIIATMQAFGIAADDAMTIVDKFNEVGNNYAISSEGVGEALLRSAAAMHAANNSLDETIALATAANTIVQDPEKVGTTLKTVSMYLRAAKTEAEEAGEATEGMATSVSELRKDILALTNNKVDIQIDEDTFKSTYQILKELSEVWGELTDLTQANILEMVGGKRNSNVVAALLDNFSVAEEALKTSADSAGSALKENEKVLESIQGRINIMKASFETLSNNVISSDLVKAFVDAGTGMLDLLNGIAKVIDALGGLKTILLTVTSVLLIAKGGLIAYKVQLIAVAAVKKIITFFGSLKEGLLNVLNIIPNAIVAWKAYAAGTVSASTAMQASIPVIGLVLAAITALVGGLSLYSQKTDEARQAAIDTADAYREQQSEMVSSKETLDTISDRYTELSQGVDAFGNCISLSAEQYEEYKDIVGQIADMFPTMIKGYNEEGVAILSCKGNVEELTQAYNNLVKAQNNKVLGEALELFDDFKDKKKDFDESNFRGNEYTTQANNALKKILSATNIEAAIDEYARAGTPNMVQIVQALRDAGLEPQTGEFLGLGSETGREFIARAVRENKEVVSGIVGNFDTEMATAAQNMQSIVSAYISNAFLGLYSNISPAVQNLVSNIVSGFDADFYSQFDSLNDLYNHLNNLLGSFGKLSAADANTLTATFDLKTKFDGGECTVEEYINGVTSAKNVISQFDEDTQDEINLALGLDDNDIESQYDELLKKIGDKNKSWLNSINSDDFSLVYEISLNNDTASWTLDDWKKKLDELTDGKNPKTIEIKIATETTGIEELNTAISESVSATGLSVESINKLESRYKSLENYDPSKLFERTANGVHLNAEALEELETAYEKQRTETLQNKLKDLTDEYDKLTDKIEECSDASELATLYSQRDSVLEQIQDTADLASQYDALTSSYNKWIKAQSTPTEREGYSNMGEGYQKTKSLIKQGWGGEDSVTKYLDLMLSSDQRTGNNVADFDKLTKKIEGTKFSIMDFFQYDSDNNLVSDGLFNFLDVVKTKLGKEFVQISKDGTYAFDFTGDKIKEVSKATGLSIEAIQQLERAMSEVPGFDVFFDSGLTAAEQFESTTQGCADTLKKLGLTDYTFNFDTTSIDSVDEQLKESEGLLDKFRDKDGKIDLKVEGATEAATIFATLAYKKSDLEAPAVMSVDVDTSDTAPEIDKAIGLLQEFKDATTNLDIQTTLGADTTEAKKQVDDLLAKMSENQIITGELDIDTASVDSAIKSINETTEEVMVKAGLDTSKIDGYTPPEKTVKFKKDSKEVDEYDPENLTRVVTFDKDSIKVDKYDPKNYKRTVTYSLKFIGDTFANGTVKGGGAKGIAKAYGDWRTTEDGIALGGELGQELIVRDGRFFTIGDDSAEFFHYKKGDIIFNAEQTRQLLYDGKIGNGKSRGTAFVEGTAFDGGSGGQRRKNYGKNTRSASSSSTSSKSSSTKSSSKKSDSSSKKKESAFEKEYKRRQHLREMDKISEEEYLKWLDSAYKKAYKNKQIELDDYYKYEEEVYKGRQSLVDDYLNDSEHEISMREKYSGESKTIIGIYKGLFKKVKTEIARARARGLTDDDDYIQKLQKKGQEYLDAIADIRKDTADSAKDAVKELVDYRIDMLKQEIESEKDALEKKLDTLKKFYDKQKELLQDQRDEEKYLKEQSEKRKSVSDIQAELAMLEKDDSAWAQKRKLELQEELTTAQDELSEFEKDRALELATDALDNAYEKQESDIQKQIDALDKKLNDPQALYNKALQDIKNNSKNQLYYQMLMYNRQYGDGNDDTVKEMWKTAFGALDDYKNLFGKPYKGVTLKNETGVNNGGSWDDSPLSENGSKNGSKKSGKSSKSKKNKDKQTPSLEKNSTIQVKKSATHFASKSGGGKMASFVPGGKYTVYQTSGNQVLIGKNGVYTGWIKKSDIVGYATGTKNATAGLHELDELGSEYVFTSSDGNKYRVLNSGDKVLNAKATDFLYEFANSGKEILEKIIKSAFGTSLGDRIQSPVNNNQVKMGDIIIQGTATQQTVSEIRRAQRDNLTEMLKSLNKLNK